MSNADKLRKGLATPESAFGELFGNYEYIKEIPIDDLIPYDKQNIFRKYTEDKLSELALDIESNGLFQPIIVRQVKKGNYNAYQILAGHNRVEAVKSLGKESISAIIKENLNEIQADLIFVNTNLNQRDKLLPSEKARAYKIQNDANKKQGRRTDLEESNLPTSGREVIVENERTIQRYIRLTELSEHLIELVDENTIPMKAGVALSYLTIDEQDVVYRYIIENNIAISVVNAENIKRYKSEFSAIITSDVLAKFWGNPQTEKKSKEKSTDIKLNLVLSKQDYAKYFGDVDKKIAIQQLELILADYLKEGVD